MHSASCCHLPVFRIKNYDYGSQIKSLDFHFAPLEDMKSTLPYPHRHDFYHIVWVVSGTGHHVIDSVLYEVRPNTLFFMAPGQVHDFVLSEETTGFTISFSPEFFAVNVQGRNSPAAIPVYDFERMGNTIYMTDAQADDLRHVLNGIVEEYRSEAESFEEALWSYLRLFLIKSSRLAGAAIASGGASRNLLLSRRFKSLLEKHFASIHEIAEYADMLKVTERALNEATRQVFGATAAKLIRERLMLEAKRMLLHTGVNVAEVANRLAFDDPAYFSRCFKKHAGCSPIEFRQSLAKLHI